MIWTTSLSRSRMKILRFWRRSVWNRPPLFIASSPMRLSIKWMSKIAKTWLRCSTCTPARAIDSNWYSTITNRFVSDHGVICVMISSHPLLAFILFSFLIVLFWFFLDQSDEIGNPIAQGGLDRPSTITRRKSMYGVPSSASTTTTDNGLSVHYGVVVIKDPTFSWPMQACSCSAFMLVD